MKHAKDDPTYLPPGWTEEDVTAALSEPTNAVQLLARDMKYHAHRNNIDLSNWDTTAEPVKKEWVARFTSAKDTDSIKRVTVFGDDWGVTSYEIVRDNQLLE